MRINEIYNEDCMVFMKGMDADSVNLVLTDIPYDEVNRKSNGLRVLDKQGADISTFDLHSFLEETYRVAKGTIIIFCGQHQMSEIKNFFQEKQDKNKGTVRQLIWKKTNPSPMNGQHIYLSGIENAIWFKKRGGTFNAHCKNTVFEYPIFSGKKRIHPTQKHPDLFKELILDNTNEGDLVFDPCAGGMTTALAAHATNREFICCELNKEFFDKGVELLRNEGIIC